MSIRRARPSIVSCVVALLIVSGAAAVARFALNASRGLTAEYLAGDQWDAPRVLQVVTAEVSTNRIEADWNGAPPPTFRVRWFGYLTIPRAGEYTFALTSDDGSTLEIDGDLVVDNSGRHPSEMRTGRIRLDRGPHPVLLEFIQAGGPYEMAWSWARNDRALSEVPAWVLSPRRVPYWQILLSPILGWLAVAALAASALLGSWLLRDAGLRIAGRVRLHPRAATLALFVALAIVHTWPLATDPAHLSRNDNGDTLLNEWALAWFAHQAPRAPLRLFEANIFYPEPHTLAYSEAMIVQSAMGAPLRWLGASPVLTFNLVLLAGFVFSGWALCLVVARWTGDWTAGLASGLLFGFNAHTLARLPHLQTQHVEFLPFALAALDTVVRQPGIRQSARLAGWFTLQALTSVYLLVFSAFGLTAAALARPEWYTSRRFVKVAPYLALGAGLAFLALMPYLMPYWQLSQDRWFSRSLEQAIQYSASWTDYLATPGRFHYELWSHRFWAGNGLFPGGIGLLLTAVAVVRGVAFRDPRARMCLAIGASAVFLSFGTKAPGYAALHDLLPLLQAIRAPVRFGHLAILATAVLAGFGFVEIRRHVPVRAWTLLSTAALAFITLESMAAPLHLTRYTGIPGIYRELRSEPHAVVVELPFPRAAHVNATYMLNSTEHWKPMLNGYSGFLPSSYYDTFWRLAGFPDGESLATLKRLGVTHLFVHLEQLGQQASTKLERTPELQLLALEGSIALFRLAPASESQDRGR